MPNGQSHKVSDHGALPASGSLSEDQFDQLVALLDEQHNSLAALIKPIHDIAVLLLADRDGKTSATKQD